MSRLTARLGALFAGTLLALTAAASGAPAGAADPAYFEFTDYSQERFVFRLDDGAKIAQARAILSGTEREEVHVHGRIIKRTQPYNTRWSYHLNPSTVDFFASAIEVCDASIPYVEDHLDEAGGAFLPGSHWCPWESRLTREVTAP
ncbi:calmodulin-binding protein [Streptomyces sp. NPDC002992]|uniref:BP74-related protein n=1 Tax=Streptomyces sp. NPDC002992 TaxID=3154273 RepID=UPI0033BD6479